MDEEDEAIIEEVEDHMLFWRSNQAKRLTVERHLRDQVRRVHGKRKRIPDVVSRIDRLVNEGKLVLIKKPLGDYLKLPEASNVDHV
jgi:hypothetical protein